MEKTSTLSTKEGIKIMQTQFIFIKGALKALERVARETEKQRRELEALLLALESNEAE